MPIKMDTESTIVVRIPEDEAVGMVKEWKNVYPAEGVDVSTIRALMSMLEAHIDWDKE